jgi:hypothetical protein
MCENFVALIDICFSAFLIYHGMDYGHPSVSALDWLQKNRALNETAQSRELFLLQVLFIVLICTLSLHFSDN